MLQKVKYKIQDYILRIDIISIIILSLLYIGKCSCFFPIAIIIIPILVSKNAYIFLKRTNKDENKYKRRTFIITALFIPMFVGFVGYVITDKIYGKKEVIIIGITNSSYSDSIDFADIYKERYINEANNLLGGFHPSLHFDVVSLDGYEKIWEALDKHRIDIAFVNAFNYYHYRDSIQKKHIKFDSIYQPIAIKYTRFGVYYQSGFLIHKLKNPVNPDSDLSSFFKKDTLTILLTNERLSGSSYFIPMYYLLELKSNGILSFTYTRKIESFGTLSDNLLKLRKDTNAICAISNDMWHSLRKKSPKLNDSLQFIPIQDSIPFDILLIRKKYWNDTINNWWDNFYDILSLRNTNRSLDREKILLQSLRHFVYRTDDTNDTWHRYDTFFKPKVDSLNKWQQ